ncbi:hypothetical protein GCM10010245_79210 [Streptomyces spectabilis]|nr:hypothetical protein GCM10010245_79210 [Streptomyces spectabilis]
MPQQRPFGAKSGSVERVQDRGRPQARLDRVRAVYWRRPHPYSAAPGVEGQDARWCAEEARYGLGGILASLPAHYVNHPWRNRNAEYKPAQLAAAVRCGFDVPPRRPGDHCRCGSRPCRLRTSGTAGTAGGRRDAGPPV